jgi:tetratricopeptide (TPR) repeat protein
MSLGLRMRQLRQMRGLTQQQLGGGKLSKSFVSLVERDRTKPSVETLVFFAHRLGTSVDALLGQEGHLPEIAADSLLAISRDAIKDRDYAAASRVLDAVMYLTEKFRLDESAREAQLQVAEVAIEQQDYARASSTLATTQDVCEREKDYWRLGRVLMLRGLLRMHSWEYPQAAELLESALASLRRARAGRDPARVQALTYLGTSLTHMGRLESALRRYQEAAEAEVTRHDPILRGRALWGLGWTSRKIGRMDDARKYLAQARGAFESAEELTDLMRVLYNLGQLDHEQGRPQEALRHFHHALRVMERLQRPTDRARVLIEIGRVHLTLGEPDDAVHFISQALDETQRTGDPIAAAEAQVVLSRIRLTRGEVKPAVEGVHQAVAVFRERGLQGKAVEVAREFGLALKERGAHADAAEFLAMVAENAVVTAPAAPPQLRTRT